jgi:hypothetical protein
MSQLGGIAAAYLCFALWHAAHRREEPRLLAGAAGAFVLSLLLWARGEGWGHGPIGAVVALLVSAALIVVVRPLAPRLVWGLAALCPLLVLAGALS